MKGFVYRTGIRAKDIGERIGWRGLWLVGMALKEWAS